MERVDVEEGAAVSTVFEDAPSAYGESRGAGAAG